MLKRKDTTFCGAVFKLSSSFLSHQEQFENIQGWGPQRPPDLSKFEILMACKLFLILTSEFLFLHAIQIKVPQ